MCYSRAPRCPKHGYKGDMQTNWQGNRMTAKCTEPGCTRELIWVQQTTIINGQQNISYVVVKDDF